MATTATSLLPSPDIKSPFSPSTESPSSPAPYAFTAAYRQLQRESLGSDKDSLQPPPSPYPATVDPSPVESHASTSTEATEIEDNGPDEDTPAEEPPGPAIEVLSSKRDNIPPALRSPTLNMIDTSIGTLGSRLRSGSSDDAPASVIHAPVGFKQFTVTSEQPTTRRDSRNPSVKGSPPAASESSRTLSTSSQSVRSEATITTPGFPPDSFGSFPTKPWSRDAAPLNTQVPPESRHGAGSTPRASTQQEAEEEWRRRRSLRSSQSDHGSGGDYDGEAGDEDRLGSLAGPLDSSKRDIDNLQAALTQMWTVCKQMANLSSNYRERIFSWSNSGEVSQQAWKSCWRLCQNLYETWNEDQGAEVKPTLELCRDFCQALFEARQRGDEITDSILRVSFELNNHLYNTHDRTLPDAFRERTLDFYLTMCHRLMKQGPSLPEETDSLLRAGWNLAELLFSLRQNHRDGKVVDEELLSSAVQACWDLADLFREGWNNLRPDRGTPKPTQRTFPFFAQREYPDYRSASSLSRPSSVLSKNSLHHLQPMDPMLIPETPTTIFDDRDDRSVSDSESVVPNILVLGPGTPSAQSSVSSAPPASIQRMPTSHRRYGSNGSINGSSSNFSDRTTTSRDYNRGITIENQSSLSLNDEPHLLRLKALILKAANNLGFARQPTISLPIFVKTFSQTAFGTQTWQMRLLESYKKLVQNDPTLRDRSALPSNRQFSAIEVAKAVQWMGKMEQFAWFWDLYRLVFGFGVDEAVGKSVLIQT